MAILLYRVNPIVGLVVTPVSKSRPGAPNIGLKIETLRHAQGRLGGTQHWYKN
jgi:hypothetical protein